MYTYLSKVFYILSGSRRKLLFLLVGFTLSSVLEAFGIGLLAPFIRLASEPNLDRLPPFLAVITTRFNVSSGSQLLVFFGLAIACFFIVKSIVYFGTQAYIIHFASRYQAQLSLKLLTSYLTVPYEFHLTRNTASLIKNILIETSNIYASCLLPLLNSTSNIFIISCLLLLLGKTDLILFIMFLLVLLPIFILFHLLRNKFKKWGKTLSQSQQGIVSTIAHAMGGLKETKVIGCEPHFTREMSEYVNRYARSTTFFQSSQLLPKILIETALITFILSFLIVTQLTSTRSIEETTGILSVFAVAAMRLIPSTSQLLQSIARMRNGSYALDMLYRDLKDIDEQKSERNLRFSGDGDDGVSLSADVSKGSDFDSSLRIPTEGVSLPPQTMIFGDCIELKNISYRYSSVSEPALDNISLKIERGESIAFIGKSGAGKTTLVDVILGLLNLERGDILVDGVSIYQNIRSWQNLVGYIPQSIFLTDDTIEHNIAFGVSDLSIDRSRIAEVIETAQLTELVAELPDGVKTKVGERGIRLSGGQRQRIGIARALYHKREILVLDEATAALDNETEHLISEAIRALAGQKTLITIAHRLSTIEHCDRVYLLENGRIVKAGSYQEIVLQAR